MVCRKIESVKRGAGFLPWRLVVLLLMALALVACGPLPAPPVANPAPVRSLAEPTATATPLAEEATPEALPTETPTAETEPATRGGNSMTNGGVPVELLERAKREAASLARSSAEEVQLVSAEAVEWSDSSLGCPKAGMMYAQVITPGYKIVLSAGGRTYEFHSATDPQGPLVRCGG